MAKYKIALCITDLDIGGAERALVSLATGLDRTEFEPEVYCLGPMPADAEASCVPPLQAAGIPVHLLDAKGIWSFPAVVRRLRRHLLRQRPDLVQTFLFHANIVGRIAASGAGVPRVVSGIRVAERQAGWHLWLDRLTQARVDRHVCVSQSVAQFAREVGRLPADRLVVIPNGVDLEAYPATPPADLGQFGINPGDRVVTFVGRLERQKSVDWLLETAERWMSKLGDCRLLLVGDGSQRSKLQEMAENRAVADRVIFAGWQADVPGILAASHLLVLPSAWEGMPNVVLQAMASRLPVVATDVEGVREILGPNADPQTVTHGDSAALIEKLTHLLSDRRLAAELGEKNRLRVERAFPLEQTVAMYADLWRGLLHA